MANKYRCSIPFTKYEEVLVPVSDQRDITIKVLCDLFEWEPNYFIEDDMVCWWEPTHGSGITHDVRKAHEVDHETWGLIKQVRNYGKD